MSATALTRRLPDLAAEIAREHELCEGSYRTALQHAAKVGELLIEAKGQLEHGDWLPWLTEHTPLNARTAQRYMQVAGLPNTSSATHLRIEDALQAVARPSPAPPAGDLRSALRGVDRADAEAALAELGPMRSEPGFPSTDEERESWREIRRTLERITRSMDEAAARGLSNWSRREALHEAARHARNTASALTRLADSLA
jgi:hypothetical protein